LTQHVSGTSMPIIRSKVVSYAFWCPNLEGRLGCVALSQSFRTTLYSINIIVSSNFLYGFLTFDSKNKGKVNSKCSSALKFMTPRSKKCFSLKRQAKCVLVQDRVISKETALLNSTLCEIPFRQTLHFVREIIIIMSSKYMNNLKWWGGGMSTRVKGRLVDTFRCSENWKASWTVHYIQARLTKFNCYEAVFSLRVYKTRHSDLFSRINISLTTSVLKFMC
jgi:hypothetical protein